MSKVIYYNCDLCREKIKPNNGGFGLNFSNMTSFKIGDLGCTDGTHICRRCIKQLKEQLANLEVYED